MMRRTTAVVLAATLCASTALAQSFDVLAGKYTSANSGFMQPLADAFAADMNSGVFHGAYIPKSGFHMELSLVALAAPITESRQTFSATTEGFFNPPATTEAPTIFGSTSGASVTGTGGTVYSFPGGINLSLFSLGVPQLTIGSLYGTEVLLRFFQASFSEDIGTLKLFGLGLRHSISQYFRRFPVSLAFGIYQQHFEIGSIVNANSTLLSVQASWQTGVLVVYGGPGLEFSTMDLAYHSAAGDISFSLTGANTIRFTTGVALQLAFFRLFVDYNAASQSALAGGVGFAF